MSTRLSRQSAVVLGVAVVGLSSRAEAEHCWLYVDGINPSTHMPNFSGWEYTKSPFVCVREDDLSCSGGPGLAGVNLNCRVENTTCCCNWSPSCTPGTSCCTAVPPPAGSTQTVLDMHSAWHNCFGNTGSATPPPGRGARWLAFHRQFEYDFDLFREAEFACDPTSALGAGCFIEALDWHAGMTFPYGHFGGGLPASGAAAHPRGCGTGPNRPNGVTCDACVSLPECMFNSGAGPTVGSAPAGCPGFPEHATKRLQDFPNMDEIARVLDFQHHGNFHGEVGMPFAATCATDADCASHPGASVCRDADGDGNNECVYNTDVLNPSCSPRDPMFWRLHKRLDDTVRAWQEKRPFDVSIVVDRSGSMSETDSSGQTKMSVALEAVQMFADLVPDATNSRVAVTSFGTNASADMPPTAANMAPAAVGPVTTAIAASVGGCTSLGSGLQTGVSQICTGISSRPSSMGLASCNANDGEPVGSSLARKAVVLLTDGMENRPPCLNSVGALPASCGGTCGGGQFDFDLLGPHTQLCAVGFGQAGSLNGNLLTLVAERQGGIYMQSPAKGPDDQDGASGMGRFVDLKDFFVKCLGQVSDEFVGLDPKGTLEVGRFATEPASYRTCGDERLTFVGGWNTQPEPASPIGGVRRVVGQPGDLRLLVNAPSGDLVRATDPAVEASNQATWSFARFDLPLHGELAGSWRSQLIRPHRIYENGFTTDSLATDVGRSLVRREIQRLCPLGCASVLYFEDGHLGGASSYEEALAAEQTSGLLASVTGIHDAAAFASALAAQAWDLIVYAHQMTLGPESYDPLLARILCGNQRAIVTDTRVDGGPDSDVAQLHACAGGSPVSSNFEPTQLLGDGRLLEGSHALADQGYPRFSYALSTGGTSTREAQGLATSEGPALVVAGLRDPCYAQEFCETAYSKAQDWFMDALVRGTSKLYDAPMQATVRTGPSGLLASVRVLPADTPAGGFDAADVKVEVESPLPTHGVGQTVLAHGLPQSSPSPAQDLLEGRGAALALSQVIPTIKQTFALNDDGINGDLHAKNGQYGVQIPSLGKVDGMYKLRFTADFTKNGCTTRRELVRSTFVDVGVDPGSSDPHLSAVPGGYDVTLTPRDPYGNPVGPGRRPGLNCRHSVGQCSCSDDDAVDHGDGTYTVRIHVASSGTSCTPTIFGTDFPLGPQISAPPQTVERCTPGPAPVHVEATVRNGTMRGRIVSVNGRAVSSSPVIDGSDPSVTLPLGLTVIEWTASGGAGQSAQVRQEVHVVEAITEACCTAQQERIVGTSRHDILIGRRHRPSCIFGLAGEDLLETLSGASLIAGGDGDDAIFGLEGDAVANAGMGDDWVSLRGGSAYGGPGSDFIQLKGMGSAYGNEGQDRLVAIDGDAHTFYPGAGADHVEGGWGPDTVFIYDECELAPFEELVGGRGYDTLYTPLSVHDLLARGVRVSGFEQVIVTGANRYLGECSSPQGSAPAQQAEGADDEDDEVGAVMDPVTLVSDGGVVAPSHPH